MHANFRIVLLPGTLDEQIWREDAGPKPEENVWQGIRNRNENLLKTKEEKGWNILRYERSDFAFSSKQLFLPVHYSLQRAPAPHVIRRYAAFLLPRQTTTLWVVAAALEMPFQALAGSATQSQRRQSSRHGSVPRATVL